jgi:hypothetical protein
VEQRSIRPHNHFIATRRAVPLARSLAPLLLAFACASQLGCGWLIVAAAGGARGPKSDEDKAWLADFASKYEAVVAAAEKQQSESAEAYFGAVIQAHECSNAGNGQLQDGWTFATSEGQKVRVHDAKSRCVELMHAIRQNGASEEGCGFSELEVFGGRQYPGTSHWTTDSHGAKGPGTSDRPGFSEALGLRQLVPCDKLPQKSGQPPPVWQKEHVALAEKVCGEDAIIVYKATDWTIDSLTSGDERYLERHLKGECWFPKAPIGKRFSVPLACDEGGQPPEGAYSCTTATAQLVIK